MQRDRSCDPVPGNAGERRVGGDPASGTGGVGGTWAACGEVMDAAGQGPPQGEPATSAKGPL